MKKKLKIKQKSGRKSEINGFKEKNQTSKQKD